MSHRALVLLMVFVWILASPSARGQAAAQSGVNPPPSASGQTVEQNSGSVQNSAQPAPAKKVWTNEDVSSLRDQSVISTFSPSNTKSSTPGQKPSSKGKDAKWYRDNISKLQAKIPPLDEQIAALQSAIDGKPTGNGTESARPRGVKADSWPVEMDNLRRQRDGIQGQIATLYDEARRNGVPSNALPSQP
jgi:hypothetical protein